MYTEEQMKKYCEDWQNSPEAHDEKYLNSPEGHLMEAIFGKVKK